MFWIALLSVILIDLMAYLQTVAIPQKYNTVIFRFFRDCLNLIPFPIHVPLLYFTFLQMKYFAFSACPEQASSALIFHDLILLTKYEIVGEAARKESVIISCSACLL